MSESNQSDEAPTPPADSAQAPDGSPPEKPLRKIRPKIVVAGFAIAIGLALGVLDAIGFASGPVVTVLTIVSVLTASVLTFWEFLRGELTGYSRRAHIGFAAGVLGLAVLLFGVGIALRPGPELPRLPGSADVAVVGLRAADEEQQSLYDDIASSLEVELVAAHDGQVKSYADLVDPPLDQLAQPAEQRSDLSRWVADFMDDTDAELLIGGYEDAAGPGRQPILHVAAYVPFAISADAPELSGWFVLTDHPVDRALASSRARGDLVAEISIRLTGLAAFLDGLDAWQNGKAADAVAALGPLLEDPQAARAPVLRDLALLYRGHAYETRAQVANASDRAQLLDQAHHDYESVPKNSTIADRARLSLAVNAYLRAATSGCASDTKTGQLRTSARSLEDIAATADSLVALKATVNQAQVTYCLSRAGDTAAKAELPALLEPLLRLSLAADDPQLPVKRQVKALATSIDALLLANDGRLREAVSRMDGAIELEQGRLERQAQWLGLQSSWLLRLCRLADAEGAQQRSLAAFGVAATRNRVPDSKVQAYSAAYAQDLARARQKCPEDTSGPR
jgi:hypothetical protein